MSNGFIRTSDAALRAGISREAMVRLIQRGLIDGATSAAGRYAVSERSLERWIARQRKRRSRARARRRAGSELAGA